MASSFKPSFQNLDKDVERFLVSQGKFKKLKNGMIEFHGYYKVQEFFFRVYLENKAYDRYWNWEVGDNKFLVELTEKLIEAEDWPRLKKLWGSVMSKRRKLYNQMNDIMREDQGKIPLKDFNNAKGLLLTTLNRLLTMAERYGASEEIAIYSKMVERVRKGMKA
jgi:hypothetical protein